MEIILTKEDLEQIEADGYIAVFLEHNGRCIFSMSADILEEWSDKDD